ncbi:TetR/AcrR family transcriptional regulator [Maribacter arenosus]|uniref:TetR/AcrR family transcriptional regulator n=1 Tax=Maribacter arenosus TaxID=1854708 RepID=A0ABR7VI37_9FLAO|nr:TetR/AcrR family transcriptional regulator [Maribacter arenosus]MBD0851807.1 TetR/AcrR family transcriptional regulator [Maribacter arenosus]
MPTTEITKAEIVEFALQKFLLNGIQSTTIHEITSFSGISSKTVYKLIGNKSELLRLSLQLHYSRFFDHLVQLGTESKDALETLLKLIHHVLEMEFGINHRFYQDLNKYYPDMQDEIIKSGANELSFFTDVIDRGIREDLFLPEIQSELIWISLQRLYSGLTRDSIYDTKYSEDTLLNNTVIVFIRGMCTSKGLALMAKYEQFTKSIT